MNKQILRLAIPNIISNLSVPLLSSVDTALVGHLEGVYYLGALAVGGIIFNFLYWGFGFLRMGTTGLAAQAYGDQNDTETISIFGRTLGIAVICGVGLIMLQVVIADASFWLIHATPEVEKYAREYFDIRIYAAPATLSLYAVHGWFLGMQNAKYPLILTLYVNGVNIVFNVLFIQIFHMKVDGVAYGTVIAQFSGLAVAGWLFFIKYAELAKKLKRRLLLEFKALIRIFIVNRDIFIRTLFLIFTFSFFTAESAIFGNDILAANSILLQLIGLLAFGIDGFAFASESLVGKYFGAKDPSNLRATIRYSFRWGLGLGLVFAVAYFLFDEAILRIFTNKETVIALSMTYMPWVVVAPLTNSFCFIWDGIFIGATATRPMRNSMFASTTLVFLPAYFLLRDHIGNHSLWLALTLFMIMRGITLTWYAKKNIFGATG
ncbi:MAG: MATE family efflux transporter [bacterium]